MSKNFNIIHIILIFIFSILIFSCSSENFSIRGDNNEIDSAEKLLIKGDKAYNKNKYEKAIKYYEAVLKYYPDDYINCAWATYQIGYIYYKMKNFDEAKKYFNIVKEKYKNVKSCAYLSNLMILKIENLLNSSEKGDNKS